MKEFEIEVSKTVHDNFIAETEDEAIDKAMQKFENETVEIYTLDETDLGESKPYPLIVNEFNEDSLIKMTDNELENLEAVLYKQMDLINSVKSAKLNKARSDAIQAFNEAVKRVFDLKLIITAYTDDGERVDIYDAQSFDIIL